MIIQGIKNVETRPSSEDLKLIQNNNLDLKKFFGIDGHK